jgi:hypothetical protein
VTPTRLSATATLLAAAVYVFAVGTHWGRELDRSVLRENPVHLHHFFAAIVIVVVNPVTVALAGLAAIRHACRVGGTRAATGIAIVLLGPVLTARGVKAALGAIDPLGGEGYRALGGAFFPSGHAAVAMTLVVIVVCAATPRHRRWVAVIAGTVAGAYGSLIFASVGHHALDVVGGALLAVGWAAAVVAWCPELGVMHNTPEHEGITWSRAPLRRVAFVFAFVFVLVCALTVGGLLPLRALLVGFVILVTLTTLALALAFERALAHTSRVQAALAS